jgi:hypothetical protein
MNTSAICFSSNRKDIAFSPQDYYTTLQLHYNFKQLQLHIKPKNPRRIPI